MWIVDTGKGILLCGVRRRGYPVDVMEQHGATACDSITWNHACYSFGDLDRTPHWQVAHGPGVSACSQLPMFDNTSAHIRSMPAAGNMSNIPPPRLPVDATDFCRCQARRLARNTEKCRAADDTGGEQYSWELRWHVCHIEFGRTQLAHKLFCHEGLGLRSASLKRERRLNPL